MKFSLPVLLAATLIALPAQADQKTPESDGTCEPISAADVASGRLAELANPKEAAQRVTNLMAVEGDQAYGEYLAGDCASCHNVSAVNAGLAGTIEGMDRKAFYTAMVDYRLGLRSDPVMQGLARTLGTEELTALAAWYEMAVLSN